MSNHPLPHKLSEFQERPGVALVLFEEGRPREISWVEYGHQIAKTISALQKFGATKGTRIAIHSKTSFPWLLLDLAAQYMGCICVPIYSNSTPEDLHHILNDSKCEFLFTDHSSNIESQLQGCPHLKTTIHLKSEEGDPTGWHQFLEAGHESTVDLSEPSAAQLSDLATLVYTSGTTGVPKGVQLTHKQILSEVTDAFSWAIRTSDRSHCFLPLSHILGRIEFLAHVYWGFTMGVSESLENLRDELPQVKPTLLISVPRIFEKFHETILVRMESMGVKRHLFQWALDVGSRTNQYRLSRRKVPLDLAVQFELADQLVLSKIRQLFGGKLRFAISGGAPLSKEIAEFFYACGVLILEGYGLTETTAAITVNRDHDFIFGTVGHPLGEVKIKIAEDGEILVKSEKVMTGYYELPDETALVIENGWLKTGDIGEILPTGHLRITDRKKDLIKTSGGKYVAPQKLENMLKEKALISNALIYGDQKKYIVAVIQLNKELAEKLAARQLDEQIRSHVAAINTKLASFETIKKFTTTLDSWTVEGGEITPSLKIKRKFLISKYQSVLDDLY